MIIECICPETSGYLAAEGFEENAAPEDVGGDRGEVVVVENEDHVGQELGLRLDVINRLDSRDARLHVRRV